MRHLAGLDNGRKLEMRSRELVKQNEGEDTNMVVVVVRAKAHRGHVGDTRGAWQQRFGCMQRRKWGSRGTYMTMSKCRTWGVQYLVWTNWSDTHWRRCTAVAIPARAKGEQPRLPSAGRKIPKLTHWGEWDIDWTHFDMNGFCDKLTRGRDRIGRNR